MEDGYHFLKYIHIYILYIILYKNTVKFQFNEYNNFITSNINSYIFNNNYCMRIKVQTVILNIQKIHPIIIN